MSSLKAFSCMHNGGVILVWMRVARSVGEDSEVSLVNQHWSNTTGWISWSSCVKWKPQTSRKLGDYDPVFWQERNHESVKLEYVDLSGSRELTYISLNRSIVNTSPCQTWGKVKGVPASQWSFWLTQLVSYWVLAKVHWIVDALHQGLGDCRGW